MHDDGAALFRMLRIYSSRRGIAKAVKSRTGGFHEQGGARCAGFPHHLDFRKRALKAAGNNVQQVLHLCFEKVGPAVTLGHVELDGTKIKANASKHKANEATSRMEDGPRNWRPRSQGAQHGRGGGR